MTLTACSLPPLPRLRHQLVPIAGVAAPLPPLHLDAPEIDGLAQGWLDLLAHLTALQALYAQAGTLRPAQRLHDAVVGLRPLVADVVGAGPARLAVQCGADAVGGLGSPAAAAVDACREASWWVVALQSATALGAWYQASGNARVLEALSRTTHPLRTLLGLVYPLEVQRGVLEASFSPAALPILEVVAAGVAAVSGGQWRMPGSQNSGAPGGSENPVSTGGSEVAEGLKPGAPICPLLDPTNTSVSEGGL